MERVNLPFHKLEERHPGVTVAIGNGYTEAARVCLDRHHVSPIEFVIQRPASSEPAVRDVVVAWRETTQRERYSWGNATDAAEAGAYVLHSRQSNLKVWSPCVGRKLAAAPTITLPHLASLVTILRTAFAWRSRASIEGTKALFTCDCVRKFNRRCLDQVVFRRLPRWSAFAHGSSHWVERTKNELAVLARSQ